MVTESASADEMGLLHSLTSDFSVDYLHLPFKELSRELVALLAVSGLCLAYAAYYLGWVAAKPKVVGGGQLKERLVKNCPILSEYYWPTFWGFHRHLSTILRALLQKPPNITYKRLVTLREALKTGQGVLKMAHYQHHI